MTYRTVPARGFTLVELLVVIGIISVLIAILLPALNRSRELARRAACLSKIHQIQLAADVHATTHRGYYPLAGYVTGISPDTLGDVDRAKYDYQLPNFTVTAPDGTPVQQSLMPTTNALAVVMRAKELIGDSNAALGTAEDNSTGFIRNFLCPSQTDDPTTIRVPGEVDGGEPSVMVSYFNGNIFPYVQGASYVWNEFVLGGEVPMEPRVVGRLMGKANRVRNPAQTMLVADGLGNMGRPGQLAGDTRAMLTFYTTGDVDPATGSAATPVSLAHALTPGDPVAGNPAGFDKVRHRGKINIGFCDGHAESRDIEVGALSTVYLSPGR